MRSPYVLVVAEEEVSGEVELTPLDGAVFWAVVVVPDSGVVLGVLEELVLACELVVLLWVEVVVSAVEGAAFTAEVLV